MKPASLRQIIDTLEVVDDVALQRHAQAHYVARFEHAEVIDGLFAESGGERSRTPRQAAKALLTTMQNLPRHKRILVRDYSNNVLREYRWDSKLEGFVEAPLYHVRNARMA